MNIKAETPDVDWALVACLGVIVIGTAWAWLVYFVGAQSMMSELFDALLLALKIGACLFAIFAVSYTIWQIIFDKEDVNP